MVGTFKTTVDCSLSSDSFNISTELSENKMSLSFLPGSETKSGCLMLVMGSRRQRLQVKIYGKTMDPFAAFYPDKKHCRHCGVMKLRGCRVEPVSGSDTDFKVIPKANDIDGGKSLVFGADNVTEKQEWLDAFSSHSVETDLNGRARSVSLRQFRMPSLPEIDEEACSDSSDIEHEEEDSDSSSSSSPSPHSSSKPRQIPPRSRHNFIQNLDKFGCRPRCCSHPGPVSSRDCLTNC